MFVMYKYGGDSYRVWDAKRSVVVESRIVTFFEDGLPPPIASHELESTLSCFSYQLLWSP